MNYLDGSCRAVTCECVGTVYRASTHACVVQPQCKAVRMETEEGTLAVGLRGRRNRKDCSFVWRVGPLYTGLCSLGAFRGLFRESYGGRTRPNFSLTTRPEISIYFKRCRGVLVSKLLNWICSQGSGLSLANCASSHRSLLAAQRGVHDAGGLALRDDARHRRVVGALYLVAPRLEA